MKAGSHTPTAWVRSGQLEGPQRALSASPAWGPAGGGGVASLQPLQSRGPRRHTTKLAPPPEGGGGGMCEWNCGAAALLLSDPTPGEVGGSFGALASPSPTHPRQKNCPQGKHEIE